MNMNVHEPLILCKKESSTQATPCVHTYH